MFLLFQTAPCFLQSADFKFLDYFFNFIMHSSHFYSTLPIINDMYSSWFNLFNSIVTSFWENLYSILENSVLKQPVKHNLLTQPFHMVDYH